MSNNNSSLPGRIVTPAWLNQNLDRPDLQVLDVRTRLGYEDEHIPGAIWLELSRLDGVIDEVPGMVLPAEQYAEVIGSLGVSNGTAVVLYDDNWGMPAARVLWTLARYGHTNAAVLTGGIDRWEEEGYSVSTDPVTPERATFTPHPDDTQIASFEWLHKHLGNGDVLAIDTRTPREYGFGHLPDAIVWDWMNGVPVEGWDALRPTEELREELTELGVTPDKEIVTYCRSGARASHTYLLLRELGYPRVRVYDGSWLEWTQRGRTDGKEE